MDRITPAAAVPALSICTCGHTGDALESFHDTHFAPGHGRCVAPGCECRQFSWERRATDEERAENTKAMCYFLIASLAKGERYPIGLVRRDVANFALNDQWTNGPLALAEAVVADRNAARGLTARECFEIVNSSMRVSNLGAGAKRRH